MKQPSAPFRAWRARTALYTLVFAATASAMVYGLATRTMIEFSALKDRSLPFVELASGEIRNTYTLKVVNKTRIPRSLTLGVEGIIGARAEIIGDGGEDGAANVTAKPDSVDRYRLLVTAPRSTATGNATIRLVLSDSAGPAASATTHFLAPEN